MHEVRGRTVLLCAQALESTRILLNSAPGPDGLANSSGVLGRYLMDHIWVGGGADAEFPDLPATPSLDGPNRPNGIYVIRFRNTRSDPRHKDVPARLRLPGRHADALPLRGPGLRRRVQARGEGRRDDGSPGRLRRVPAALGELRRAGPERGRHVRHPGAADQDDLVRQRARHDRRHGRHCRSRCCEAPAGARNVKPFAATTASPAAASTRWASRAWARIRRKSVLDAVPADARRRRTCSSWTAPASRRAPARTRRSRSWRCACARAISCSSACAAGRAVAGRALADGPRLGRDRLVVCVPP